MAERVKEEGRERSRKREGREGGHSRQTEGKRQRGVKVERERGKKGGIMIHVHGLLCP